MSSAAGVQVAFSSYRGRSGIAFIDLFATRRRVLIVSLALAAMTSAVIAAPQIASRVAAGLGRAQPSWLALAALCFLLSALASSSAWRAALAACGVQLSRGDMAARFGVGCLVNSVTPARAGEAVRIALVARAVGARGAAFTVTGVCAAVGVVRACIVAVLLVGATAAGAVELAPFVFVLALILASTAVCILGRRRFDGSMIRQALDAFYALARSPYRLGQVSIWIGLGTAARVAAAAASAAALGVPHPIAAGLLIVPALELAGAVPLTPGNIGVTSGAVALTLRTHGVTLSTAVSTGIALHAVEMLVGIAFGLVGAVALAPPLPERARGWLAPAACVGAVVVAAAVLGFPFDMA